MVWPVGGGNEPSARPKHSRELAQRAAEVFGMEQHPCGDGAVERRALEVQGLHVADTGVHAASSRELDHACGLVDRDDFDAELIQEALSELAPPAPTPHPAPWISAPNRREHNLARVRPLAELMGALPDRQPALVRVLLTHEARVGKRHGSTIGL